MPASSDLNATAFWRMSPELSYVAEPQLCGYRQEQLVAVATSLDGSKN